MIDAIVNSGRCTQLSSAHTPGIVCFNATDYIVWANS